MKRFQPFVLTLLLLPIVNQLAAQNNSPKIDPSKIDIVRDQWGVPHIFAKTDAEVAYGLAWATAEDDFETMQWGLLAAKSMMGRHSGKEGAAIDFAGQLLRAKQAVVQQYDSVFSPHFKGVLDAFAQGANDYAEKHPKEVLVKQAFPITPQDLVTGYVLSFCLMSGVGGVLQDVISGKILYPNHTGVKGIGSNAFAFNSNITQDGNTYLAINSHQPIEGPLSWYEAHLCSEEGWNIVGGLFHGGVSIFHGTNENLGWAHTVNDFDLVDVFRLQMNPDNDDQYLFDGEWKNLEETKAKLVVKIFKNAKIKLPVKKKIWWSVYGATLKTDHGVFAIRLAANQVINATEQWFNMNKAKNYTEFRKILDMQAMARMTVVYADKYDTIYALSNGLVPRRNQNYNWEGIVPGNTSATLWKDYYPVKALPQELNPDCGYVYNVNNSAFEVTCSDRNPNCDSYDFVMGYSKIKTNRSVRFEELMEVYGRKMITWEDFLKIKYDKQMPDSMIFVDNIDINDIFDLNPDKYPDIKDAIENMKKWNRVADTANTNISMFLYTIYNIFDRTNERLHPYGEDKIAREEMFVECIRESKAHMLKNFGTINVPLGEMQRLVRGDKDYPVSGCPDAIKACYAKPYKDGKMQMFVGESYIQLVKFTKDGPQIESVSPYGASNKLENPHSTDQMEMFLSEKRKTMTLNKETVYKEAQKIYHPNER